MENNDLSYPKKCTDFNKAEKNVNKLVGDII